MAKPTKTTHTAIAARTSANPAPQPKPLPVNRVFAAVAERSPQNMGANPRGSRK
jgi:hypothetical protein